MSRHKHLLAQKGTWPQAEVGASNIHWRMKLETTVWNDVKILPTTAMVGGKHWAGSTLHLCIEVRAISQAWGSLPANPRGHAHPTACLAARGSSSCPHHRDPPGKYSHCPPPLFLSLPLEQSKKWARLSSWPDLVHSCWLVRTGYRV